MATIRIEKYGKLRTNLETINGKIKTKLNEINSFVFIIENIIENNEYSYDCKTGFTSIVKKIEKVKDSDILSEEEIIELYDLFKKMADSYDKTKGYIGEAFCLAHLIKLSYKILKNNDNDVLMDYIYRFEKIMSKRDVKEFKWYQEIGDIIDEIKKKNNII